MTIGIYALYWAKSDLIYIGQSQNIEVRKTRHFLDMSKNIHPNSGIQKMYNEYGYPEHYVLEICSVSQLNICEIEWAKEFTDLLNVDYKLGKSRYGFNTPRSKYSKLTILKIFVMLVHNRYTFSQIAARTKTNKSVVASIASGIRHVWLYDLYPEEYSQVLNNHKYGDTKRGKRINSF